MRAATRLVRYASHARRRSVSSSTASAKPKENIVTLSVDGAPVSVPLGATVMQACGAAGVDVPRFCYHGRLAVAGNCRMCLVQVNGAPKLAASCALPAAEGMDIATTVPAVRRAREGVMEMLLANHPLDCPICDQGGECDLQDQAMAFGSDRSRHVETVGDAQWGGKRAVEDKAIGPLVATSMNRCIHCTRCVRFAVDVAGAPELGTAGRGSAMEIGTYVADTALSSNLSGNIADLCPVGALTSKPYAFRARPWELYRTDSVDVLDGVGSAIRVDSRGPEVMRVLPREHDAVNEEWLGDKSRFAVDALRVQRLTTPLVRRRLLGGGNGESEDRLVPVSWEQALVLLGTHLQRAKSIAGVAGKFADAEAITVLKRLCTDRVYFDGADAASGVDAKWLRALTLHTGLPALEEADAVVLVGTSPREEVPVLNVRLRRAYVRNGARFTWYGAAPPADPTYALDGGVHLDWRDVATSSALDGAKRPLVLVGQSAVLDHSQGAHVLAAVCNLVQRHTATVFQGDAWCGLSFLALDCARVSALALGCEPCDWSGLTDADVVYLLNSDDERLSNVFAAPSRRNGRPLVVYQGHHGDVGASVADVVLPGAAYTEKDASWTATDGRIVTTRAAVAPPGDAREDWAVLRAVLEASGRLCGETSRWQDAYDVREAKTRKFALLPRAGLEELVRSTRYRRPAEHVPLRHALSSYYMSDALSRHSPTMAACVSSFGHYGGRSFAG